MDPYDDPSIFVEDWLIRRISHEHHVVPDENLGCWRISSKAFSPSSGVNGGMSVDIERLIAEAGIDPSSFVTTPKFLGSVAFTVEAVRALDLQVGQDPVPENPYHGQVWGKRQPNRFTRKQKRGLASAAVWYVPIPNVELR